MDRHKKGNGNSRVINFPKRVIQIYIYFFLVGAEHTKKPPSDLIFHLCVSKVTEWNLNTHEKLGSEKDTPPYELYCWLKITDHRKKNTLGGKIDEKKSHELRWNGNDE